MDDIKWAAEVLEKAVVTERLRLKRGLMRRAQMAEALGRGETPPGRGETPPGPRMDWLLEMRGRIIDVLQQGAKEFNEANPDDLISVVDMGDVLTNALHAIKVFAHALNETDG